MGKGKEKRKYFSRSVPFSCEGDGFLVSNFPVSVLAFCPHLLFS